MHPLTALLGRHCWLALVLVLPLALAGCAVGPEPASVTLYLIRHAETVPADVNPDRPLNELGQQRARWLAAYFSSRELRVIYSTPITRTLQTVSDITRNKRLDVATYDPRALAELAEQLRLADEPTLVAGHSNTTPALLNLLLREERYEQLDDAEHSLIFVVTVAAGDVTDVRVDRSQSPPST
ncbi:MAG: histidine phosphatase family protein [Pseudomonadota bacterium]